VLASGPFVPTCTGCYNASGGTINKLAVGDQPLKPCASDLLVRFSAGDITKISVTGGLTGGGDNGDVTISLDPKYSLPQACFVNAVAKWTGTEWLCAIDDNTTYSAGIGLDLVSTAFSIEPGYRLPQGCADGQIPKRTASGWACGSEQTGAEAWVKERVDFEIDIPMDGENFTELASLTLPAGAFLYTAVLHIRDDNGLNNEEISVSCKLDPVADSTGVTGFFPQADIGSNSYGNGPSGVIVLHGLESSGASHNISLKCRSFTGSDHAEYVKLSALKVGAVHIQ